MTDSTDLTAQSVAAFIAATASKSPTPGGGSVAGVVGALGTALGEMALVFTRGKKAFAEHEAHYAGVAARLAKARELFATLVAEDMAAYALYQQATRAEGADKDRQMHTALTAAIAVPREMTKLALAVLADLDSLVGRCNKWLLTDLAAGAVLAEAVVRLSDYNVRINARDIAERTEAEEILASSAGDCEKARQVTETIETWAKGQL